jgi:hypothetical protein
MSTVLKIKRGVKFNTDERPGGRLETANERTKFRRARKMLRLRLKSIGENRRQIASANGRRFEDCVTGCEFEKEVRVKWNKSIRQNKRQKTIAMISEGL